MIADRATLEREVAALDARLAGAPVPRPDNWGGFRVIPDVDVALATALDEAAGTVVVAGSLYLVGEARRRWVDDPSTRDPEVPDA